MSRSKSNAATISDAGIPKGWGEFLGISLLAVGGLMLGGLASYQFGDGRLMGPVGRIIANAVYAGFGMAGYLRVLGVLLQAGASVPESVRGGVELTRGVRLRQCSVTRRGRAQSGRLTEQSLPHCCSTGALTKHLNVKTTCQETK